MERLSGLDAGFLYMETATFHMHTLKIGIVDPSTSPGGYDYDRFKRVLADRLHLLPAFRQSLVDVPFGLHHPLWIADEEFDLDYHLRRVGVPRPGTRRELNELIGEIASRPLSRERPLWQLWVVDGLESGHIAFVTKMHHAVADGAAASAMLANVMSPDPTPGDIEDVPPFETERRPPRWFVAVRAIIEQLAALLLLPALIARTYRSIRSLAGTQGASGYRAPRPVLDAPRTSFNGALTPHRSFATADLSLSDAKAVKRAAGVTLNDVLMATVSGAMRRFMDDIGESPRASLLAAVPVGTDLPGDEPRLSGNRVSNMFTTLATDVDDPLERIQRIHDVTEEAKRVQATLGKDMMSSWVEYTPALLLRWFMKTYSGRHLANRHAPPINLVVSNVPGPPIPLYVDGARLTELYSVGPILEGVPLNITIWSYQDRLHVSALSCREYIRDPHAITDHLQAALDELVEAAGVALTPVRSPN